MEEFETKQEERTLPITNQRPNTSVMENIPSEVVYDIIVESYSNGHFPSKEEIITEYAKSINPIGNAEEHKHNFVQVEDKETGMITGMCKECGYMTTFVPEHSRTEEIEVEFEQEMPKFSRR